jgi:hypothetical protein
VPPHVHRADYFARHIEVVEAARAGDRIFSTDWRGDSDERLTDAAPTIAELLCEARRGVNVGGLLWRSHSEKMRLNARPPSRGGDQVRAAARRSSTSGYAVVAPIIKSWSSYDGGVRPGSAVRRRYRPVPRSSGRPGTRETHRPRRPTSVMGRVLLGTTRWSRFAGRVAHVLDVFAERWDDPTPLDYRIGCQLARSTNNRLIVASVVS